MGVLGKFINAFLLDIIGRKKLLMTGIRMCGVVILSLDCILLSLNAGTNNVEGNRAAASMMFAHIFFYASTIDAFSYLFFAEIWPTHIRSKDAALCNCGVSFSPSLLLLD